MIFQFTFKKIISLLACISITISCLVIPASAAVTPGQVIEGIGTIGTLWDIGIDAYEIWQELNPDKDPTEYPGFNPGGSFSGAGGSRDDAIARYEEYVNGLQTDLGTHMITSSGDILVVIPIEKISAGSGTLANGLIEGPFNNGWSGTLINNTSSSASARFMISYGKSPVYGVYSGGFLGTDGMVPYGLIANKSCSPGSSLDIITGSTTQNFISLPVPANTAINAYLIPYARITPTEGLAGLTNQDVSINSRPSSIVGDYGIMGDDGTIVKVEGGSLVNESEKLVYSPTTAGEITYTDCVFDYADRSYTLTLEDGSTMKVVYGDENVTIHEGDTIYNVYYLSGDSESGGSGGGSGSDGEIGDAVSGLLGGLGNILAGLIEGLLKMAAQAVEALGGLIDIFNGLVDMILGFFSGFTGFLGSMFPFLPEETFVILNFGLILLIAAAVIKKLFL